MSHSQDSLRASNSHRTPDQQFDDAVSDFESRWERFLANTSAAGAAPPMIATTLVAVVAVDAVDASVRHRLLVELCEIDIERRCRARLPCQIDDYVKALPLLAGDPAALDQLAASLARWQSLVAADSDRGRFRVAVHLGQGGVGRVSMARDRQLNRDVAIKELRAEYVDDPTHRARLVIEAEIASQLDHPGVAPIYSLETDANGAPFYSMKLVQGRTLKEHIDEYHRDGRAPLALRKLLQHFISVCQTIAFAHQRNIVHRDITPQNVFVGDFGETIVLDWGLGKRIGSTGATESSIDDIEQAGASSHAPPRAVPATSPEQRLGTPSYMSPEQAAGARPLTTAADVFGLGALLYQILTNSPPYPHSLPAVALEDAAHGRRLAPSDLVEDAPAALEAICHRKAMAHEPEQRYATATELATDVERWLADEEVSCHEDSATVRLLRQLRRNPRAVGSGITLILLLLVGVPSWYWADRAAGVEARRAAVRLVARARNHLDGGEAREALAPLAEARRLARGRSELRELRGEIEALSRDAQSLVQFASFEQHANEVEFHLLGAIGDDVDFGDGDPQVASIRDPVPSTELERALAETQSFLDAAPTASSDASSNATHPVSSRATHPAASSRTAMLQTRVTRLQRLLEAAKHRPTRGGGAVKSDDGSSQMTLTADFITHHLRALDFGRRGKWSEMETHLLRALAARPDEYWSLFRLARALDKLGRANEAEQVFLSCLALRPNSSHARAHRAYVLFSQRRWEDARASCEEALAIDPNNTMALSTLIVVLGNLGDVDAARSRYGELVRLATNDRLRSKAENALGVALENAKRLSEAIECYEAALKIDPENIAALRNRALAYMQTAQSNEALAVVQRAVELRPDLPEVHFVLANAFFGLRQNQEAEKAFTTAIELDPNFALAYYNRGVLRRKRSNLADAMADQERALDLSPNSANLPNVYHERAQILGGQSQKSSSEKTRLLLAALDEINHALARRSDDADYLVTRAKLYGDLQHFDLAVTDLNEVIRINPAHQDARFTRGMIFFEHGAPAGLVADFLELIKRQPDHPQSAGLWNSIAVAREKLADIDGARDAFKSSLKIAWNPDHAENHAQLELGQRRLDVTIGLCDEILQRAPDRWRALALRGRSRFRIGDVTAATSDLDRAFELKPELVEARVLRAEANLLLGKVSDARRDLQAVSINAAATPYGQYARGVLPLLDGNPAPAMSELPECFRNEMLEPLARAHHARAVLILASFGSRDVEANRQIRTVLIKTASADVERMLKLRPNEAFAQFAAARILVGISDSDLTSADDRDVHRSKALEMLEHAKARAPWIRDRLIVDEAFATLRDDERFKQLLK